MIILSARIIFRIDVIPMISKVSVEVYAVTKSSTLIFRHLFRSIYLPLDSLGRIKVVLSLLVISGMILRRSGVFPPESVSSSGEDVTVRIN